MTSTSDSSFDAFMVRRLVASTAFVEGDADPLLALSATADPATIFGPAGTTVQGADAVNAVNARSAAGFEPGGRNAFEVLHSGADGALAYWVGVQRSVVRLRGRDEPVPMALRVTEIFRFEAGAWTLVHRHADPLRGE